MMKIFPKKPMLLCCVTMTLNIVLLDDKFSKDCSLYHGRYLSKVLDFLKLYEGTQKFRANYNLYKHNYS